MSRLIYDDKLIETLRASQNTGKESFSIDLIIECINDQPTAYDLDKVVRELEEKYDNIPIQYDYNYESGLEDGYADAIEIVKRGGKNER